MNDLQIDRQDRDPLESLDQFYEACRTAPLPPSLTSPPNRRDWRIWLVPAAGLLTGAIAALVLVLSPLVGSGAADAVNQTTRAIFERQMAAQPAPSVHEPKGKNQAMREETKWNA